MQDTPERSQVVDCDHLAARLRVPLPTERKGWLPRDQRTSHVRRDDCQQPLSPGGQGLGSLQLFMPVG
jgi:hypothetical protein